MVAAIFFEDRAFLLIVLPSVYLILNKVKIHVPLLSASISAPGHFFLKRVFIFSTKGPITNFEKHSFKEVLPSSSASWPHSHLRGVPAICERHHSAQHDGGAEEAASHQQPLETGLSELCALLAALRNHRQNGDF